MILLADARLAPGRSAADAGRSSAATRGRCGPRCARRGWAFVAVVVAIASAVAVYPRLGEDLFPDVQGAGLPDALRHQAGHLAPGAWTAWWPCCSTKLLRSPAWPASAATSGQALLGEEIAGVELLRDSWITPVARHATTRQAAGRGPGVAASSYPGAFSDVTDLPARADRRGAHRRHHRGHRGPHLRPGLRARSARSATSVARGWPGYPAWSTCTRRRWSSSRRSRRHRQRWRPRQRYGLTPGDVRRGGRDHDGQRADVGDLCPAAIADSASPRGAPPARRQNLTALQQLPIDTPERRPRARSARSRTIVHRADAQPDHHAGERLERCIDVDANVARPQPGLGHRRGPERRWRSSSFPPGYRVHAAGRGGRAGRPRSTGC